MRAMFGLDLIEHLIERLLGIFGFGDHPEHDLAVHRDEPAIAIPREPRVAALLRERVDRGVVEPEVEDRVHHAGHRRRRAGAHADEQWLLRIAELCVRELLDLQERRADFSLELGGIVAGAVRHHVAADLGHDREAGRNRQAERGHLGEVRALATERSFVFGAAFCFAAAERFDERHDVPPSLRKSAISAYGPSSECSMPSRLSRSLGSGSITITPPLSKNAATTGRSCSSDSNTAA